MPSAIELAIERQRAALLAGDANALARMTNDYQPVRTRLLAAIDELVTVLETSDGLTAGQAVRLERAQILLQQVEDELARFAAPANGFIESAQRQAIGLATAHVQASIFAQAPSLTFAFNRLNTRAVENLVGRMADGSPLRSWLDALGPDTAKSMEQRILDGVALGQNPRKVARLIGAELAKDVDMAGYRILNHTRTQMLGAYRGATLERYRENADIIGEWEWISAKQSRTCRACLGLDGRRFPLTEKMQKAHNACRCTSIPVLPGVTIDRELGKDWLAKQDEKTQDGILGKQGGKAYRAGDVALEDFVALHKDKEWGDSYRAGSLKSAQANAAKRGTATPPKRTPKTVQGANDADTLSTLNERGGATLEPARDAVASVPTFNTTSEARDYLAKRFANTVALDDVPVDMANRIVKAMSGNFERFVPQGGKLQRLATGFDAILGKTSIAKANSLYIIFSPKRVIKFYKQSYAKRYANVGPGKPRRWTVQQDSPDSVERLFTHEFAHVIDYQTRGNGIVDAGVRARGALNNLSREEQSAFLETFSEYGMTNKAEFWAELYTMRVYEPERLPKSMIDEVDDILTWANGRIKK